MKNTHSPGKHINIKKEGGSGGHGRSPGVKRGNKGGSQGTMIKSDLKESLQQSELQSLTGPEEVFTEVIPYYGRVPLGKIV